MAPEGARSDPDHPASVAVTVEVPHSTGILTTGDRFHLADQLLRPRPRHATDGGGGMEDCHQVEGGGKAPIGPVRQGAGDRRAEMGDGAEMDEIGDGRDHDRRAQRCQPAPDLLHHVAVLGNILRGSGQVAGEQAEVGLRRLRPAVAERLTTGVPPPTGSGPRSYRPAAARTPAFPPCDQQLGTGSEKLPMRRGQREDGAARLALVPATE